MEPSSAKSGTQSLGRAFLLLRLVARGGIAGATLVDLAAASGLARPTAHRLLKLLVAEGMLERADGRYRIGPLAYEFGLLARPPARLVALCRPTLVHLARETGDTLYLTRRSGIDGVCIDRVEGSHPVRALTIDIGGRRPLGVGATGIALLAALPRAEADEILHRNAGDYARYGGLTAAGVRENVDEARLSGFGYTVERITPGVSGIGIAIPDPSGVPQVGLSIASVTERIVGARRAMLEDLLTREARRLGDLLASAPDGA